MFYLRTPDLCRTFFRTDLTPPRILKSRISKSRSRDLELGVSPSTETVNWLRHFRGDRGSENRTRVIFRFSKNWPDRWFGNSKDDSVFVWTEFGRNWRISAPVFVRACVRFVDVGGSVPLWPVVGLPRIVVRIDEVGIVRISDKIWHVLRFLFSQHVIIPNWTHTDAGQSGRVWFCVSNKIRTVVVVRDLLSDKSVSNRTGRLQNEIGIVRILTFVVHSNRIWRFRTKFWIIWNACRLSYVISSN
jgi:hypothetical protein